MEQERVISRQATLQPASPGVEEKYLSNIDHADDMALLDNIKVGSDISDFQIQVRQRI